MADRKSWRFDGRGGVIDLRLRRRIEGGRHPIRSADLGFRTNRRRSPGCRALGRTGELTEAGRRDPRGPRQFGVELDPGPGIDRCDRAGRR